MKYADMTKEERTIVDKAIGYELQSIGSLLTGTMTSEDYGPNPYYNTIMAMPNGPALWQVVDDFVTTDETKEINKALEEAKKEEEEKRQ